MRESSLGKEDEGKRKEEEASRIKREAERRERGKLAQQRTEAKPRARGREEKSITVAKSKYTHAPGIFYDFSLSVSLCNFCGLATRRRLIWRF